MREFTWLNCNDLDSTLSCRISGIDEAFHILKGGFNLFRCNDLGRFECLAVEERVLDFAHESRHDVGTVEGHGAGLKISFEGSRVHRDGKALVMSVEPYQSF